MIICIFFILFIKMLEYVFNLFLKDNYYLDNEFKEEYYKNLEEKKYYDELLDYYDSLYDDYNDY